MSPLDEFYFCIICVWNFVTDSWTPLCGLLFLFENAAKKKPNTLIGRLRICRRSWIPLWYRFSLPISPASLVLCLLHWQKALMWEWLQASWKTESEFRISFKIWRSDLKWKMKLSRKKQHNILNKNTWLPKTDCKHPRKQTGGYTQGRRQPSLQQGSIGCYCVHLSSWKNFNTQTCQGQH